MRDAVTDLSINPDLRIYNGFDQETMEDHRNENMLCKKVYVWVPNQSNVDTYYSTE